MAISHVIYDQRHLLLLVVLLLCISGDQQDVKYIPLGGVLQLLPDTNSVAKPITGVLWKHDLNKAAEWDEGFGPEVDYYGTFKNRTALNKDTGELVINNTIIEDSGIYSVEINGRVQSKTHYIEVIRHSLMKTVGEDAVLPCEVDPTTDHNIDLTDLTIKWTRPDLPGDQYVYYQRNGGELVDDKDPSYKGRTSLFQDEVKKGNVSLKLTRVTLSDEGTYTCTLTLPGINTKSTVHLTVAPCQVRAVEGGDVVLPCQTVFTGPLTDTTVKWTRKDLTTHHVHVIRNDQEQTVEKNSVYKDRTSVSVEGGDVSLRISGVNPSDAGLYTCYITSEKECVVHLTVESSPVGHGPLFLIAAIIITIIIIIIIIMIIKRRSNVHTPTIPPDDKNRPDRPDLTLTLMV